VFLFPDEAFFAGDRANVGALNALITEPTLTIEGKGVNIGDPAPNRLHIMMASNETWVVPASAEARRYFILDVLDAVVGNKTYFIELNEQMENGGYEAMLYDLINYNLTNFDHRHPPKTAALDEQKKLSLGTTDAWWKEVFDRGYVFQSKIGLHSSFGHWFSPVSKELLYKSYLQFSESRHERHPISREAMGKRLLELGCKKARPRNAVIGEEIAEETNNFGDPVRRAVEIPADRSQGYLVGDLDGARKDFQEATKITVEWGVPENFEEDHC
jgi:hypothetical protein